LDKYVAPVIDQDAGHWMLDTGLIRHSADFINRQKSDTWRRRLDFASDSFFQHPVICIMIVSLYIQGINAIFQQWITRTEPLEV